MYLSCCPRNPLRGGRGSKARGCSPRKPLRVRGSRFKNSPPAQPSARRSRFKNPRLCYLLRCPRNPLCGLAWSSPRDQCGRGSNTRCPRISLRGLGLDKGQTSWRFLHLLRCPWNPLRGSVVEVPNISRMLLLAHAAVCVDRWLEVPKSSRFLLLVVLPAKSSAWLGVTVS